jgi:transposase-like protein
MSRVELMSGPERRRRWSEDQKRAIVAEAFAPGASVCEVARRADVVPGQIYRWRQELRTAVLGFAEVGSVCHRFYDVRIRHEREMAGTAQADRAPGDESWGHAGSLLDLRDRHAGRNPSRGAIIRVELIPIDVRDPGEIDRGVAAFASGSNDGLIVVANPTTTLHRDLIIKLAARHRLPAVYWDRVLATGGGLIA